MSGLTIPIFDHYHTQDGYPVTPRSQETQFRRLPIAESKVSAFHVPRSSSEVIAVGRMVYAMDAFLCDGRSRKPCSIRISGAHVSESGNFYCEVSFAPLLCEEERIFADSNEKAILLAFKFLRLIALGLHVEDKDGNAVVI